MTGKIIRIHQFAPSTSVGDGVTTGLLLTQKLLQGLGYESHIFSAAIPKALEDQIQPVDQLRPNETDLLLVHHSMGHDHDELIETMPCPMVLVYHNITPEHYFDIAAPEHHYSIKGRQQLRHWKDLFMGAIGDSPYNSAELIESGYRHIDTLPMLVDLEKFGQKQSIQNTSWGLTPLRPLLISVGRIAENKRQHLLITALWYLKQLNPEGILPQLVIVGGTTSPEYDIALKAHIEQLGLEDDIIMPGKCSDEELSWLYQNADCYWCASEHEGFCMPLIESGFFELPVITFASSNIPATLGEAGLIIEQSEPQLMAATTAQLLADNTLQRTLINAGKRNLDRYRASTLMLQLEAYLIGLKPELTIE